MVLGYTWPWPKGKKRNKTINIFLGYFFVLNFCVGTGFLGIPYSFFYSGYMAAIPTLLLISAMTWINSNYLLEIMARAQALENLRHTLEGDSNPQSSADELEDQEEESEQEEEMEPGPARIQQPKFEITLERKFEISEMCEIFVSRYLKYVYLALMDVYNFLRCLSFATVAASAWASNIPFSMGAATKCSNSAFFHSALPSGGCLYSYYFCLVVFAIIVITISLFELREQAIIQFSLGILRFVAMGAIVVYCVVRLSWGGDACIDLDTQMNETEYNETFHLNILSSVFRFDFYGWVTAIPIFVFATIFLTGLSSVSHPIKQKRYLRELMVGIGVTTTICYMSLGVVVPLWFRASIQETCTLNWASFTQTGNPAPLRSLSYFLVLFPSLDVIAAYPLVNHVIVNNLYILITGQDTSRKPRHRCDRLLRIFLHIITGILPILAAFGVANLIYVLKYGGLAGFVCYFFPSLLQFLSIRVCKKKFSSSVSPSSAVGDGPSNGPQKEPLLPKGNSTKEKQSLYMTPYSIRFLSHPVCVLIVGGIGLVLFVFAFVGLFVHPEKQTCH